MSKPKPYILHVIDAICESTLPPDLRHLLIVMAYKADNETGRGISGQETIGRLVGCSDRAVRLKLERLAAMPEAPVQVVRHYRQRADGRGRGSDEYLLVLTNRKPASGETERPTGSPLPLEGAGKADDQPEVQRRPTGTPVHNQPEAGFQGSTQGSTQKDLRSLFVAPEGTIGPAPGSSKKGRGESGKPKPQRTPEQLAAFNRTKNVYFQAFEAKRGEKPVFGKAEGRSIWTLLEKLKFDEAGAQKAISTAFQSFRGGSVTILNIAANPQGFEAETVKARPRTAAAPQPGDDYDLARYEASNA